MLWERLTGLHDIKVTCDTYISAPSCDLLISASDARTRRVCDWQRVDQQPLLAAVFLRGEMELHTKFTHMHFSEQSCV